MNVKPVLGGWEIPRIAAIETLERRAFVELAVPGRVGSLFQDLNSEPTLLEIHGSLHGEEDKSTLFDQLRARFQDGEPVTFVADITTATEVQYVVIEELWLGESGRRPDQLAYRIRLRESPPPPPPADPFAGLDSGLLDQAGDFLDTVSNAVDLIDGLGSIPDIADPTPPLRSLIDGVTTATASVEAALGPLVGLLGSDD